MYSAAGMAGNFLKPPTAEPIADHAEQAPAGGPKARWSRATSNHSVIAPSDHRSLTLEHDARNCRSHHAHRAVGAQETTRNPSPQIERGPR